MTSYAIESATIRLVAQCLNQLRYSVPAVLHTYIYLYMYKDSLCCLVVKVSAYRS
jgi:hypothetical protein